MVEITDKPLYLDAHAPLESRARDLAARLTLEEKVALMAGAESFAMEGVERLGVPRIRMTDGPTGVRSNVGEPATVFPVGAALAATWNPDLVRDVAAAIGREALALGAEVVLAPTVNIVRTPLWGRNFETFSEDPFLTGALGAAYVEGLQSQGVGASLKHYAANNQEENRMVVSVEADERTLREIYLAAFEHVVTTAKPWTVMASYNKVGGVYATENSWLIRRVLKGEWGYDGVVVSDWGAVHSTAPAAIGGTDLEMPGPARWFGEKLLAAVRVGEASAACVDEAALRLCRLILRTGVLDGRPKEKGELRTARHRQIAERAALEAVVLLKNDGDLLPLDPAKLKRLAVVGPNASARRIQGGGSSQVRTDRRVSILAALQEQLAGRAEVLHADGGDNEPFPPAARAAMFSPDEGRTQAGLLCEYFADDSFERPLLARPERALGKLVSQTGGGEPARYAAFRWSGWFWPSKDGRHELSLRGPGPMSLWLEGRPLIDESTEGRRDKLDVGGGLVSRKIAAVELEAGRGYALRVDYVRALPTRAEQAAASDGSQGLAWEYVGLGVREPKGSIAEAAELAATCDAAVVVIGSASVSEGEGYDRPDLELPGDQNALVEAVLAANPRTVVVLMNGAPYALPWIAHAPAVLEAWFGGEAGPDATAKILLGSAQPSGRLPVTFPARLEDVAAHRFYPGGTAVSYGEGLRVGYRGFDEASEPPMFPFGFGLTYTKFRYADIEAPSSAHPGEPITISFTLANLGQRPGKETAQLYVRPRGPSRDRPVKELKAFRKVELGPGEAARISLDLDARAFAFFDPSAARWVTEPGAYDLLVGGSAADVELQATVRIEDGA
jgi:beta-glucosidase